MTLPDLHELLTAADQGNRQAKEQLFATLYEELHLLARRQLGRAGGAVTLSATTLLHEVYLGLAGRDTLAFPDRPRFFAYAARAMRGFIISSARNRRALKRGGGFEITQLDTGVAEGAVDDRELCAVGEALDQLELADSKLAELVDLKYFGGLTLIEIGALRGVSERTMQRDWEKARLFLFDRLNCDSHS
jgi:RNA polymerase sigma factor (TIGR02999 family)